MIYTQDAAIAQGYTLAVTVSFQGEELELLIKPDTDLDTYFKAYCLDYSEMVRVEGWLCTIA